MTILTQAAAKFDVARTELDIPDLDADFSPAPIQAGLQLVNQFLAGGTLVAIVAMIAVACLIAFGGLSSHNKSKAWVALGVAAVGAALLGSISGAMTFFGNIPLF